jgi:hypothetical protein
MAAFQMRARNSTRLAIKSPLETWTVERPYVEHIAREVQNRRIVLVANTDGPMRQFS